MCVCVSVCVCVCVCVCACVCVRQGDQARGNRNSHRMAVGNVRLSRMRSSRPSGNLLQKLPSFTPSDWTSKELSQDSLD